MVFWKTASSVIVVSRNTGRVLVLRRGASAKFMPGMFVFPGGVTASSDEKLGVPGKVTAIRELFEETGIIIGQSESAATSRELEDLQERTRANPDYFKLACPSPPCDELLEWNTWLTPSSYKQRFMTSFYVARVDSEPVIRMCEKEMTHHAWMEPLHCLTQASESQIVFPPPQVYELTRISQTPFDDLHKHANTTYVLCPQVIEWRNQPFITSVLPGDHLYVEEDQFHYPPRTLPLEDVRVELHKATHREVYCTRPLYSKCKIYMHKLLPKYREGLHQFDTESKNLQNEH